MKDFTPTKYRKVSSAAKHGVENGESRYCTVRSICKVQKIAKCNEGKCKEDREAQKQKVQLMAGIEEERNKVIELEG